MSAKLKFHDGYAVVTLDNPPVNAIGVDMRIGLLNALEQISAKANQIDRVIVTGAGRAFAAGADAKEFDGPLLQPYLPDVIAAIEKSPIPWIAAINGVALGGGAEIALACHLRIASKSALIGLPEVTLGVIPGAGGTQRLPRLIGYAKAVEMISTGKPLKAEPSLAIGLVDQIAEDAVEAARIVDLSILANRPALCHVPPVLFDENAEALAITTARRKTPHQIAPLRAIELVKLTTRKSFADGMKLEREAFLELRQSDQAKALRHVFFAERAANKPNKLKDIAPLDIKTAVVVGGGTMGASIAYALDGIGIKISIIETNEDAATRAKGNVAKLFDDAAKRGLISETSAKSGKERIDCLVGYGQVGEAQLAIEAAFEDMQVKKEVFRSLESFMPKGSILASNTSYLNIDEIAAMLENPSRVIGLHFFSPAHIMKLLEIIEGAKASDTALATGFELAKRLGKIPVLSGVCDGFIGNRILAVYREITDILMMDGASPYQIDQAMVEFGYPMGPYEMQDLAGLDIAYANRKRKAATRDPNRRYIPISDRMVEAGRLGRKSGKGWYDYSNTKSKIEDPFVGNLIAAEASKAGVVQKKFSNQEIRDYVLAAMINEAAAILGEGIAASASDIDLVLIHGYSFPRWRGGLMHFANMQGIDEIHQRVQSYAKLDPLIWKTSDYLANTVKASKLFL